MLLAEELVEGRDEVRFDEAGEDVRGKGGGGGVCTVGAFQ